MNYEIIWDVEFKREDTAWNLGIMSDCVIEKSVKNLADRAILTLPETQLNKVIHFDGLVKRGDEVSISLGYKGHQFETEFTGYVKEIIANGGNLTVECEDALFLFRVDIPNKQFKPAKVSTIANYLIQQVNPAFKLVCDYDIPYEKFTIYKATAYDVLAKIQEETGADIYFDTKKKELHIHPAYTRKEGNVDFSPQHNIEVFALEYKTSIDKKVEVTIESVGLDGKVREYTVGNPGGEKITKKVGRMSESTIKMIADNEYKNKMTDGYEGSFDAWCIPFVEPSYTAGIYDSDYPNRDSRYYVEAVKTTFSKEGISRNVGLGIKLSA